MFTAKESQNCRQFSAKNPPDHLGHMALQLDQNYSLPCFPPSTFATNVSVHGHSPEVRGVNTCQRNALCGFSKLVPSIWDIPYPNGGPYPRDSHCALGLGVTDTSKPIDNSQRQFLIFDQAGNHTRLFVTPSFPPQNQIIASKTEDAFSNGSYRKLAPLVDHEPIVEEKWDENDPSDGEGDEMHEDTEEINALLYSDSDDEYDEDDGESAEVTSACHTPFAIEEGHDKENLLEKLTEEEVASSDGSRKRQRLLDHVYEKSHFVSFESPVKKRDTTCRCEDYVGSSCSVVHLSKRENKVKVREALKILECMIPGLKTNDPLSIIDHAIGYLKSMKIEAESLGLDCLERNPAGSS